MVLVSTAIAYPPPRHPRRSALGPVRPARWSGPKLPHAFPTDLEPAQVGPRVCAGHRPAAPEPDNRQNRVVFDTPTRYMRRAPVRVSAGQRPSQHVVACEGFEPSKLSRWIYRPWATTR